MVIESYRGTADRYLEWLARPWLRWAPAALSWLAFGLCVAAAVLAAAVRWTTPDLFLAVSALILLGGLFDALDGYIARRNGTMSVRGDVLDHVLDRYSDVALLIGIAISGYANPFLALLALVSLLLVSYMGTQAQAVGQGRLYAGILSRSDRLVILAVATFLEFDWSLPWPWAPSAPWSHFVLGGVGFTVIDVALVWFIVAGQWTAYARARSLYRSLPPSGS